MQVYWAESLFHEPEAHTKGNRSEIEGKYFTGYGEVFFPSGDIARDYESLHWRAGRYLEILVQTAAEPLVIEACGLVSTRFPLESEAAFSSSDASLEALMPLGIRALQASSHDSYMDGPMLRADDVARGRCAKYPHHLCAHARGPPGAQASAALRFLPVFHPASPRLAGRPATGW